MLLSRDNQHQILSETALRTQVCLCDLGAPASCQAQHRKNHLLCVPQDIFLEMLDTGGETAVNRQKAENKSTGVLASGSSSCEECYYTIPLSNIELTFTLTMRL